MSTSVTRFGNNLPNGGFIPEIWSKRLNYKFYKAVYYREIFNTDWQGEIGGQGSKVWIRTRPTVIVGDYKVNSDIVYQDLQDDKIELDINYAKYFAFKVDDIDKAQADINIEGESQYDAEKQVKIAVETQIYSTIYSDATSTLVQAALDKTNVVDWIIDAKTQLHLRNVPVDNRWIILPPQITSLLHKSDLKASMIMGDGPSLLRRKPDYFGRIAGFDVFESNCLTATSGGTVYQCIAGQRSGVTFAAQIDKVETLRLQNSFGDAVRGLMVFGYKTNQPDAVVSMPATVA
jgi:hypothetical protein